MRFTGPLPRISLSVFFPFEKPMAAATEKPEADDHPRSDTLPVDILGLLEEKLFSKDRIRFRSTCKTWQSAPSSHAKRQISLLPSGAENLPVLLMSSVDGTSHSYYHPVMNTTYTLEIPELHGAKIRMAKDGWLFVSKGEYSVFFLNPFTREKIELPDLPYAYCFQGVCFSCTPTSLDCKVMCMNHSVDDPNNNIQVCLTCHGDDEWYTFDFQQEPDFRSFVGNPVFDNGVFYVFGSYDDWEPFDPEEEEEEDWSVIGAPDKTDKRRNYYFAEYNGEFFCVCERKSKRSVKVSKYKEDKEDQDPTFWERVRNLGDKMMFVSRLGTIMVPCSKDTQKFGFGNKVFLPRFNEDNGVFYHLPTGRVYRLDIGWNSDEYYEKKVCAWIQPVYEKHKEKELKWHD